MKLVVLLAAAIGAIGVVIVWRTQHGPEVWHTTVDAPS